MLMTMSAIAMIITARHKCATASHFVAIRVFGDEELGGDENQRDAAGELQIRQQHQPCQDADEDDPKNHGDTGADHQAPAPLRRRQFAACHGDDHGIVARQQEIDENDPQYREPERRVASVRSTLP